MYANVDSAGNRIIATTRQGMNIIGGKGSNDKEDARQTDGTVEERLAKLEAQIERIEKQGIVVVGTWDGTNIPITIQGSRRKIATIAP